MQISRSIFDYFALLYDSLFYSSLIMVLQTSVAYNLTTFPPSCSHCRTLIGSNNLPAIGMLWNAPNCLSLTTVELGINGTVAVTCIRVLFAVFSTDCMFCLCSDWTWRVIQFVWRIRQGCWLFYCCFTSSTRRESYVLLVLIDRWKENLFVLNKTNSFRIATMLHLLADYCWQSRPTDNDTCLL